MNNEKNNDQMEIGLSNDIAQGTYANLAIITHSSSEFVLDFIRAMPGVPKADVKSRIILTPEHAKRLLAALNDNIRRYENTYGTIRVYENNIMPPIADVKGEA